MAEPIDYLKTYLSIDPSDYSAMEAQIAGEPIPERQQYYMPSYTPQVDLSQMPEMQLQPSTTVMPQVDDRYQSLMDQIESLKAQIAALEAGQAPVSEMPTTQETMVEPVVTEETMVEPVVTEETMPEPVVTEETMPAETIDDVMAGEDLGVVTEQPTTPMDDYLRDMEDREMQINLGGGLGTVSLPLPSQNTLAGIAPQIPNLEEITQGIEDLRNRITAGGGKPEDFQIYKPPLKLPTQEAQDFVGLPEGYSYTPPEGRMYASVMPKMGMRFAYGPDGERIEVTDTRTPTSTPKIPKLPKFNFNTSNIPSVDESVATSFMPGSGMGRIGQGVATDRESLMGATLFGQKITPESFDGRETARSPFLRATPTQAGQTISPISQGVDSILFPPKASISPFPAPFNLRNQMIRQPMQFAGGGSLDASLQDLKSRLSM